MKELTQKIISICFNPFSTEEETKAVWYELYQELDITNIHLFYIKGVWHHDSINWVFDNWDRAIGCSIIKVIQRIVETNGDLEEYLIMMKERIELNPIAPDEDSRVMSMRIIRDFVEPIKEDD